MRRLRAAPLAFLLLVGSSCAAWQGRIAPDDEARVRSRLEGGESVDLESFARRRETIDEAIERAAPLDPASGSIPRLAEAIAPPPSPSPEPLPDAPGRFRGAASRSTFPITIADVREEALRNNLDLQIAQLDPRIASVLVNEERAKFDDLIFARAKYGKKYTPRLSGDLVTFKTQPGSILEGQEARLIELPERVNSLELDAGISVPLRTGGRVAVSAPFSQKNALTDIPSDQWLSALRFSVSQPLLRDAGVGANVASIRIAEYDQRATDVKTRLQAIRVLATIDKAYWSVFGAWAELDVRRQQFENARDNLQLVRRRVAEGISPAVEENRAQVGVAERLESLVQAETALKLRERQLKLFLNSPDLDLGATVLLVPETKPLLVRYDFDREALVRQALEGRLELLELELKLASDLVKIDYLQNQVLPVFTLEYSYAPLGQSGDGFGGSWSDTFSGPYDEWFVGGRFEIPLTNLARRSKLERAILERQQRLSSRRLRELTVRREIFDALDQLQQNWQRILAARQNVLVAGINYEAELVQFREGLRTMTEVLEGLTRLGEAQVREIKAIVDYQVAQIDLAFATGTLLGYSRVYLPGISTSPGSSYLVPGPSLPDAVDGGGVPDASGAGSPPGLVETSTR